MEEICEKVDCSTSQLKEEAIQITSRVQSSFNTSLEAYGSELAEWAGVAFKGQRQAMRDSAQDRYLLRINLEEASGERRREFREIV